MHACTDGCWTSANAAQSKTTRAGSAAGSSTPHHKRDEITEGLTRRRSSATAEDSRDDIAVLVLHRNGSRVSEGPPSAALAGVYTPGAKLFYPKGVPQHAWLSFYAEHFDTVKINNTFYTSPSPRPAVER